MTNKYEERIKQLEKELELEKAKKTLRINPKYFALANYIRETPASIQELSLHFNTDSRSISQWIYQLKRQYNAEIITLSNGQKQMLNNPFENEVVVQF